MPSITGDHQSRNQRQVRMPSRRGMNEYYKYIVSGYRPDLKRFQDMYQKMHYDKRFTVVDTAELYAAEWLLGSGFEVIPHEYGTQPGPDIRSYVGVLRNGSGRTVLLRADVDAPTLFEPTNEKPYGNEAFLNDMFIGYTGNQRPEEACAHNLHPIALMATATTFASARAHWSGTLICLFRHAALEAPVLGETFCHELDPNTLGAHDLVYLRSRTSRHIKPLNQVILTRGPADDRHGRTTGDENMPLHWDCVLNRLDQKEAYDLDAAMMRHPRPLIVHHPIWQPEHLQLKETLRDIWPSNIWLRAPQLTTRSLLNDHDGKVAYTDWNCEKAYYDLWDSSAYREDLMELSDKGVAWSDIEAALKESADALVLTALALFHR